MKLRVAISALFILIAAMVVASQGAGLEEKLKAWKASCTPKISEVRAPAILDHSRSTGSRPRVAGAILSDAQTVPFNFAHPTDCLGSHARHLQRFARNLIHGDHQGE